MEEYSRYVRQMSIQGWGTEAQDKIAGATVCVTGLGGLGSPVSLYLAAAGVGTIILVDFQELELSNLNRQILYTEADIGSLKLDAAEARLSKINSSIAVVPRSIRITDESVYDVCAGADLIVDCLDNYESRYVLNRFSLSSGTPFLHAGINSYYGQMALLNPPKSPCLECFIPPESVGGSGPLPVLGAIAGVVGSLQAAEAIKVLIDSPEVCYGTLRIIDVNRMTLDTIEIEKNPLCTVCGG